MTHYGILERICQVFVVQEQEDHMTEQRAEYHLDGEEKRPEPAGQIVRELITRLASEPEWFASMLTRDQARAIVQAIMQIHKEIGSL